MANNTIKRVWKQAGINIEDLSSMLFQAESGGHTFAISGADADGNPVALSGTPAGVFLRPDNTDVALTCSVSNGVVYATLPAECYAVQGRGGVTIFLTSGGQKSAIYAAVVSIGKTTSGNVSPGTTASVVDLINAINAAIAQIPASDTNLKAAMAPTYSTSAVYAVGDYAWNNGVLYRCTTAITSGETWTSGHWTAAAIGSDSAAGLRDLKSALLHSSLNANSILQNNGIYELGIVSGEGIASDTGLFVENSSWKRTSLLPVNGLDKIYIAKGYQNKNNAWYKADGTPIDSNPTFQNTSSSGGIAYNVPEGAYFVAISTQNADPTPMKVFADGINPIKATDEKVETAKQSAKMAEANAEGVLGLVNNDGKYYLHLVTGSGINENNGDFETAGWQNWSRTEKIFCGGVDKIYIISDRITTKNCWYDINGEYIDNFSNPASSTLPGGPVTVPSGACYFALTNLTANMEATEVRIKISTLDTLKTKVAKLENDVAILPFEDQSIMSVMNGGKYALKFVTGEYINSNTGEFAPSTNWTRTEKMVCKGLSKLYIVCNRPNPYNYFYDENGDPLQNGQFDAPNSGTVPGISVTVPSGACYFAMSNLHDNMRATEVRAFIDKVEDLRTDVNMILDSVPGVGMKLQYLTDYFDTPIDAVLGHQSGESVSMVFITDSHHMQVDNQLDAVSSIEYILERVGINAVIVGGDNHNDPGREALRETTIPKWAMEYMNEVFRLCSPILPLIGNHDDLVWRISNHDGDWIGEPWDDLRPWYFSPTDLYKMQQKRSSGYIVRDPENPVGNYYYYDIPGSDFRVLCLNTSDIPTDITITKTLNGQDTIVYKYNSETVIGTKQVNFVANMLENYNGKLIVCSHANLNDLASALSSPAPINSEAITGMLYAWKNGTSFTYTGSNSDIPCSVDVSFDEAHTLVGCFNGHTHYDTLETIDGIQYVSILNSQCAAFRDSPERTDGTITKIAYDVITVVPEEQKVYLTRFGAGDSRYFTYTEVSGE